MSDHRLIDLPDQMSNMRVTVTAIEIPAETARRLADSDRAAPGYHHARSALVPSPRSRRRGRCMHIIDCRRRFAVQPFVLACIEQLSSRLAREVLEQGVR